MKGQNNVFKRGIWKREMSPAVDVRNAVEFDRRMIETEFVASHEEFVRKRIASAIAAAKDVLRKSGHPVGEGIYRIDRDGEPKFLGPPNSEAVKAARKTSTLSLWPYFLAVEQLTIEEFAVDLIHNANGLLQLIEAKPDSWVLASMSMYFGEALYKFQVEHTGIASKAELGLKVSAGRSKSNAARQAKASKRRSAVLRLAQEFLANKRQRHSQLEIAGAVSEAWQDAARPSMTTIRYDLAHLTETGQLDPAKVGHPDN